MWEDNCKIDLKQQGLNNVGGGGGGGHRDIGNYLQKDTAWYHRTFYSLSKIFVWIKNNETDFRVLKTERLQVCACRHVRDFVRWMHSVTY
jgi:hypothetical protein